MGQYWTFYNIDREQRTSSAGKLGEFFFHCPTRWLLFLVIPASPTSISPYDDSDAVYGSWAGDRIILMGDYADEFPDGILTDLDTERLEDFGESKGYPADEWSLPALFQESCTLNRSFTGSVGDAFHSRDVWVLRNLSKREYVRSNGIPLEHNGRLVYDQRVGLNGTPGLNQVLLSRIGWSRDCSIAMSYNGPLQLHQGPWAGDRFDIRVFNDVIESMKDEGGWVDVTRIVARDMFDLAKSDNDWEGDFEEEPEESDQE